MRNTGILIRKCCDTHKVMKEIIKSSRLFELILTPLLSESAFNGNFVILEYIDIIFDDII
mgnify:CR=1 FL=1